MNNTTSTLDQQQPTGDVFERINNAARESSSWEVVLRPSGPGEFPIRVRTARAELHQLEKDLARRAKANDGSQDKLPDGGLRELESNPRMLRSAILAVADLPKVVAQLPRVIRANTTEEPRVAAIAAIYLRTVDGNFSADTFRSFVHAFQERERLTVGELWNLAAFIRFVLLESLLEEARHLLHSDRAVTVSMLPVRLKSLRAITNADLVFLIEPLIAFDATLSQDPASTYARMDFESREVYRKRVADVARHSDCTESQVAQMALDLAREGSASRSADPRVHNRRAHVGYYLIDKGFPQLAERVGFHPTFEWRAHRFVRAHGEDFYITGIQLFSILFLAAVLFPILPRIAGFIELVVALLLALFPVTQDAVDLINSSTTAFFEPTALPKLDFSKAIPQDCTTLVTVPTLLLNEKQVRELVNDIEVRYLANRDPNLHFALLTDLSDSVNNPHEKDSHPLVDLAARLVDELNAKYSGTPGGGCFIFLHRHRVFNARQGVWMGWERKRGKLLDLNKLLTGEFDAFPIKSGCVDALRQVRYIITLDSDTELPRGTAARLIGAIAHPLNQAIIDPKLRVVTEGYGILQPRVGVAVRSTARSRLAAIYSGQNGFDIYTRAISDAYQDLFGEGSFTGKGIYEARVLHAVLNRRFPRNALLSHDLIEGAYARAGLVTDVEIVDEYPSHYSAYSRRIHRWVRGDWQILQWIFSRVPDESGRWGSNPISEISRWKIFDNLRRSLVDPFLLILFVAGWCGLPGGALYWTVVSLILLIFPTLVQFTFSLGRAILGGYKGQVSEAFSALGHSSILALFHLIFLPHQTLLTMDAIVRSLVRRFITGQRLLEWETAAQAEMRLSNRTPVDRYLTLMPVFSIGLAALVWLCAPHRVAIICAAPILLLWSVANAVTAWLDRPPRERVSVTSADEVFLLSHALRIWRYFYQFGGESHNYLIPDNVEEDGLFEAARVSPTNIGLLLNARQVACELGFLTLPEFVMLTRQSLASIGRLKKYRGHLYNWYNTQTLEPLDAAPFVSSVDSGNFVASLYTLHSGAKDLLRKPLLTNRLFEGLRAHWRMMQASHDLPASIEELMLPAASATCAHWLDWLPDAEDALSKASQSPSEDEHSSWWREETLQRVNFIRAVVRDYIPWASPEFAPLRALPQLALDDKSGMLSIKDSLAYAEALDVRLAHAWAALAKNASTLELAQCLRTRVAAAINSLRGLIVALRDIANDARRIAEETEFAFLIDPGRQILSIGYDVRAEKLHEACYDMIASEARIATFLAIARGDLPQQSWFKLSRDHARAYGRFLLLSWSGTMFEYLMPALWMRSYPDTLIARTQEAVVFVQRAFARSLGIPWGISESGAARKDDSGHYHYKAFGVPRIALWFEADAGPVVSPYSSFLALCADPKEALRNLRRMEAAHWVGAYGFYESADFISSRRNPVLTREWMAHHQGMSLLAVTNFIHENMVQQWFHENPLVQATELLLHETPVSKAVLKAKLNEFAPVRAA
jgi:hypothetical protein